MHTKTFNLNSPKPLKNTALMKDKQKVKTEFGWICTNAHIRYDCYNCVLWCMVLGKGLFLEGRK
ncbi:MAG: hypothetical protein R3E32_14465 [Chitinophagales bacterium]